MIDQSADVSAQVKTLISAPGDDAALLEQLKSLALAHEAEFAACAGVWAPGLYERNPAFFGPFLVALYFAPPQAAVAQPTFSSSYPLLSSTVIWRG